MSLGKRVKLRRKELRWTQDELARRLGVRQNVVSRLEADDVKSPNITNLRRLARTLGVTSDYLIGMYDGEDERPGLAEREARDPPTPAQALQSLRALVGRYFDGVDAHAYVAAVRGGAEEGDHG